MSTVTALTTALEAGEVGYEVFLNETNPYLGGRVGQLNQYFPKLSPPACGLEINFRRIKDNPRIKVLTMAEVEKVEGAPGNYTVAIKVKPRYVNENCTCCGACAEACGTQIPSEYDFGMQQIKAAYLPFAMAFPARYVIDPRIVGTEDGKRAQAACKYDAVDLEMQPKTLNLNVGAVVWATGWVLYDAKKMDNLGFGKHLNIYHQHDDGAPGGAERPDPGQGHPPLGRPGAGEHRLRAVRRLPRRERGACAVPRTCRPRRAAAR